MNPELIRICNLAIPPNKDVCYGLGDLLEKDQRKHIVLLKKNFLKSNKFVLKYIAQTDINDFKEYKEFSGHLSNKGEKFRNFLDNLRVFMIKCYFSNPYVLDNTGLIEPLLNPYSYFSTQEDDIFFENKK